MRWKTPALEPYPKEGDKRVRHIFALTPHECEDGFTRWFEIIRVYEKYTYHYGCGLLEFDDSGYSWDVIGYDAKEQPEPSYTGDLSLP